jgi:hypothetical protein
MRRSQRGDLEPRMVRQALDQPLTDDAGRTDDTDLVTSHAAPLPFRCSRFRAWLSANRGAPDPMVY